MVVKSADGRVVARDVRRADTFMARLKGLMFQKQFPAEYDALLITPCNAVHTMFMRYAIDVLFLDSELKVLHICHSLRPWRLSPLIKGAVCVIESDGGSAVRDGIQVGDRLYFQE